ncbi:MAG: glycogen-binding domain-containing protein [Candidatus Krumholzibacteriota bacterium]|nr:glycogen-binding domain-containing protein [Candidatus Krumholzibacteriota bacterium]
MKRRYDAPLLALLAAAGLLLAQAAAADYPRQVTGGIEFSYRDPAARQVSWAGEYNGWSTNATRLLLGDDGVWRVVIDLGSGEHEYKFVVDGNWIADPSNPRTRGEYGNSWIKVAGDGSVVEDTAGGGRLPSLLNSQLTIGGFYYALYQLEAVAREGDRVLLEKPTHDINLALEATLNPSLRGLAELNIDNIADPSEMWRTRLNLQRARLSLTRPSFTLDLFENVDIWASDDPLRLVGQVGTYAEDYGLDAAGALFFGTLPGKVTVTALAADAGLDQPYRPDPIRPADSLGTAVIYSYVINAGYRDDLALEFQRVFGGAELTYVGHAKRGIKPGNLFVQTGSIVDTTLTRVNYRTVQNNLVHGLTYRQDWTPWLQTAVEYVYGTATLQAKDRAYEKLDGESYTETFQDERSWELQDTRGILVTAAIDLGESWRVALSHRYQRNRNTYDHLVEDFPAGVAVPDQSAAARSYALALHWARGDASYRLGLEQEEFRFEDGLVWGDHFWFADGWMGAGNLWIDGDQLPLDKYGLVGYRSASVIRQSLQLPLARGKQGDLDLALSASVSATRLDRRPLYWDLEQEWNWRFNPDWSLLYNARVATYDHEFLDIDETFVDHFVALSYHVGRAATLSLGWGVNPYWLDPRTKTFKPHGRREYLAEQGADENALRTNYSRLGALLLRAEDALRDVQRITLEGRFTF